MGVGAIVLTGGRGSRLGGVDKAALEVDGRTLLEIVLAALVDVPEVEVVGPEVPGGPAAGLLAGLARFERRPDLVVVLAVDLPGVTAATVARLLAAAEGNDGAVLDDGRRQHLCAAYSSRALLARAPADPDGLAVHRLVGDLDLAEVPAEGAEAFDVDTWQDLAQARDRSASSET